MGGFPFHRENPFTIAQFTRPEGDGRELLVLRDGDNGTTGSTDFMRCVANIAGVPTLMGNIGTDGVLHFTGVQVTGVTTGVLHADVDGNVTSSCVSLTADVCGTLPIANGGTNAVSAIAAANNLLPSQTGSGGKYLKTDGAGILSWDTPSGGSGTVTSVALTVPSQFTVSGSPVTTSGTLSFSWNSQSANLVLASPDGSSGAPTFRSLAAADIPSLDAGKITTGTFGNARLTNSSLTVTAGTGLSGGGAVSLGGVVTVSLSIPVSKANGGTGGTHGVRDQVRSVAANDTFGADDGLILVDATTGAVTITLHAASDGGHIAKVVKTDVSINAVTVACGGGDSFWGVVGSLSLATQGNTVTVESDGGSHWAKLSAI